MNETELNNSFTNLTEKLQEEDANSVRSSKIAQQYVKNHSTLFSARTQSRIKCLSRLLHELQKNEFISPENVILLAGLIESVGNDETRKLYLNHRSKLERVNTAPRGEPQLLSDAREYPRLPGEVRQLIADRIGRKWTDLARNLSVPDAEIDEIEERYRDNPRRINAMLIWFEQRTSAHKQLVQLINALNRSRRKDLAEIIGTLDFVR